MTPSRHMIVTVESHPEREFNLDRTAELTGVHPEMILEFVRAELVSVIAYSTDRGPKFDENAITRLRHIDYLRRHEQASLHTIRYIVRLLDRLDATDRELRSLRERTR